MNFTRQCSNDFWESKTYACRSVLSVRCSWFAQVFLVFRSTRSAWRISLILFNFKIPRKLFLRLLIIAIKQIKHTWLKSPKINSEPITNSIINFYFTSIWNILDFSNKFQKRIFSPRHRWLQPQLSLSRTRLRIDESCRVISSCYLSARECCTCEFLDVNKS